MSWLGHLYAGRHPQRLNMIIKTRLVLPARCCMCDRLLPETKLAVQHTETAKILCIFCLINIAEIEV